MIKIDARQKSKTCSLTEAIIHYWRTYKLMDMGPYDLINYPTAFKLEEELRYKYALVTFPSPGITLVQYVDDNGAFISWDWNPRLPSSDDFEMCSLLVIDTPLKVVQNTTIFSNDTDAAGYNDCRPY